MKSISWEVYLEDRIDLTQSLEILHTLDHYWLPNILWLPAKIIDEHPIRISHGCTLDISILVYDAFYLPWNLY